MWIPESEKELERAIEDGDLVETATFDAKADLPKKGKSKDLAIDVAAMANDGGTLLYGVGEDEHGRLTVLSPIELSGARERVDHIVRSSISEPPNIETRIIPKESEPGSGYLLVVVPPSPRAPHMVIVGKDYRYYGRSDTGNVPLTEGEVARLYERRRRWEIDRETLLDEEIARAPLEPHGDFAYLHLVARPVVPDEDLLDRTLGNQNAQQFLSQLLAAARKPIVFPTSYVPDLFENMGFERRADGWATSEGLDEAGRTLDRSRALDFQVDLNGGGHLFCGRAGDRYGGGRLWIYEDIVAGLTTRFLAVLGGVYAAGKYLGQIDVGVSVTGLKGGVSQITRYNVTLSPRPFDKEEYCRTSRFSALGLAEAPRSAARELVLPLVRATTRESYDPFAQG